MTLDVKEMESFPSVDDSYPFVDLDLKIRCVQLE